MILGGFIHEENRERKKQLGTHRRLPAAAIPSATPGIIAKSAQSNVSSTPLSPMNKKRQPILLQHNPPPKPKRKSFVKITAIAYRAQNLAANGASIQFFCVHDVDLVRTALKSRGKPENVRLILVGGFG